MAAADNNNVVKSTLPDNYVYETFYNRCMLLKEDASKLGIVSKPELRDLLLVRKNSPGKSLERCPSSHQPLQSAAKRRALIAITIILPVLLLSAINPTSLSSTNYVYRAILNSRCLLQNNFFVMEISRPVTNCSICRGVHQVVVLNGDGPNATATKSEFAKYAYESRPVVVKRAAYAWNATRAFSFDFFKKIYSETEGAFESVEDECQFFPFRTDFVTLRDVFAMSPQRAKGLETEKPWYIGWSNCHHKVAEILRKHYSRPNFLPDDSESSAIDWIFMGWAGQGASVHLDYVQRPSWQAQISGKKTWRLFPTPECEDICGSFDIIVEKGDIVLIDTNQWYHDTFIHPGEISITIGSEYD